jgi:phosphatidylserine/phosphatidylglycerophosphate/cardiolipin synthase-like enzyme
MNCQSITPIFGGEFPEKVLPLIQGAKSVIKIIVFDWRWYPSDPGCACQRFNNAIVMARKRGVAISVLTNCKDVIQVLRSAGIVAKGALSVRLLHSKMIIVDNKHLVIGSHNYTQNAFTSNFEASVILHDCDDLAQFDQYFNSLCA